jgi:hypothetical protein
VTTTDAEPVAGEHAVRAALIALVLTGAVGFVLVSVLGGIQVAQAPISDETGARPVGRFAPFALDTETNAAAAYAALLAFAGGALALLLATLRPTKIPRWALLVVAVVLGYLGVDEWFEIHERLPQMFGISRRLYFIPAALIAFAGWVGVFRGLGRWPVARAAWLAAPVAWVVSQVLAEVAWSNDDPVRSIYKPVTVAEEVLEMTGSFLFGVALVVVLASVVEQRAAIGWAATSAGNAGPNAAIVRKALWAGVALEAAAIAVVSTLGAIQVAQATVDEHGARPVGTLAPFALDTETNPAAAFAAFVLLVAALLCGILAWLRPAGILRWALIAIGALLAFMAIDEWSVIHEDLEETLGVNWRVLYLPAAVAAAVPWLFVLRGLRRYPPAALAWIAAPALWILSQLLNVIADTDDRPGSAIYKPFVITEEILEMSGSFMFGVALLIVLAALVERRLPAGRAGHS